MNKRITNGLSANNFSRQYLGLSYDRSFNFSKTMVNYHETIQCVGLVWGFQSRFFSSGHVDISIGLFNRPIWGVFPKNYSKNFIPVKHFVLATQPVVGVAIGDWKKSGAAAKCEALFCEEDIQRHWEVGLPDVTIGQKNQNIGVDIALENRLRHISFSIQPKAAFYYSHRHVLKEFSYSYHNLGFSLKFRYYVFQTLRVRKGKSGYNFSGPYASFLTGYYLIRNRHNLNSEQQGQKVGNISIEPAIGFQQRLFKKLFVDGSVFYTKNIVSKFSADRKGYFASWLGLGFIF
ncbi:hypothetical protein J2Y45_002237 [Dyadobacter sp. BE34]|uniref:Lipid A deacylase LpxR family protein n=1 Tax=Dyadobacter fermentans TaxID=94254 RepID=A0ABU1QWB8_9BACT|nr:MULTISPECIES: hypothetical protein [Dyadobacter]MDR6805454.1 hypothetical protein [Dyadobacter fermentans]MDR7042786.1 hypothetical protein [Dyadobacter sp. BE242]MDR7197098.1 hypothetical protein [Dyadobacter sp. BE34]MDR7215467.1 hypothetical protein [Dyadobacter sp. BE31]MDR7263003.1 hypothetical protein [Dyadobacter sp. BE32]